MDDRVDAVLADHAATSAWSPVSPSTSGTPLGDRPVEAGGQVVDHDQRSPAVDQRETMWPPI